MSATQPVATISSVNASDDSASVLFSGVTNANGLAISGAGLTVRVRPRKNQCKN